MRNSPARLLFGVLALAALWPAAASARVVERVAAVINDEVLLLSQVNDRMRPLLAQLQQIPDATARQQKHEELKRQMLQMMIDEELIRQEAAKLKLTVSEKDLELAIADVMKKNNLTREQLEDALRQEGKDLRSYKETILRPQLLRLRVLNVQVRSRIMVGDEEVKAFYQKNLRALGVGSKVHARHIFVSLPRNATTRQVEERRRYAESLLARLRKGEDFAAMARKLSEDPATRDDGGDLGWFERGSLPGSIEEVVFAMKKGEIRGPLMAERGFHLIQLLDHKESGARSLDEVKDELREQLYMQKMEKATQAWLSEVRKRSHIDIKL
jgi:peptidyl-prolyl cis-trans isomerase SurA